MLWPKGPTSRTWLNRADPRLRGVVTWFPFDGHLNNTGDLGGRGAATSTGVTFQADPIAGTQLLIPAGSAVDTTFTASQLGMGGTNRPWTFFLEFSFHLGVAPVSGGYGSDYLFGLGTEITDQAINFGPDGFLDYKTDFWGNSYTLSGVIQTPNSSKRCVVVLSYNDTNYNIYSRTYDFSAQAWRARSASTLRARPCALPIQHASRHRTGSATATPPET
jgi:hypothetical protein